MKSFFQAFLSNCVLNNAKSELLPENQKKINVLGLWAKLCLILQKTQQKKI